MNTDWTFDTIGPFACVRSVTAFHSGSSRNAAQLFVAASRLSCAKM